jgi:hypothetical protein
MSSAAARDAVARHHDPALRPARRGAARGRLPHLHAVRYKRVCRRTKACRATRRKRRAPEAGRYAAFDAVRASLARWPLSVRNCRLMLGVLSFLFGWLSIPHAAVRPFLEEIFSRVS